MTLLEFDHRQRHNVRIQLTTFSQSSIASQNRRTGHRIEPRRNSQFMHIRYSGASGREHPFRAGLRKYCTDPVDSSVHQEPVRFQIGSEAVVSPTHRVQYADQLLVDPRALQQYLVGPGGVAVHALEQNRLIRIRSGVETIVEFVVLRPECERNPADGKNVPSHAPTTLLRVGCERHQLVYRTHVLADLGRNQ